MSEPDWAAIAAACVVECTSPEALAEEYQVSIGEMKRRAEDGCWQPLQREVKRLKEELDRLQSESDKRPDAPSPCTTEIASHSWIRECADALKCLLTQDARRLAAGEEIPDLASHLTLVRALAGLGKLEGVLSVAESQRDGKPDDAQGHAAEAEVWEELAALSPAALRAICAAAEDLAGASPPDLDPPSTEGR